jgi:hypothetical protein
MIFQWSRATRVWELVADSGESIGTASPVPGDLWEAQMSPMFGGRHALASDLDMLQRWMMAEASEPR